MHAEVHYGQLHITKRSFNCSLRVPSEDRSLCLERRCLAPPGRCLILPPLTRATTQLAETRRSSFARSAQQGAARARRQTRRIMKSMARR